MSASSSAPTTAPARSSAGRPNQREHILDVALDLVATHGAAKMSMRQLARACGLNVAAIYHYFDSKDALVAAVVEERRYGARLAEVAEIDPSLPADERLRLMFREIWQGALDEERIWRVLLGEGLRGEPAVLPVGRNLLDVLVPGLAEWVRLSVPEADDPAAVAELLIGQMFTGFIRHIFEPDLDPAAIEERAVASLVAAVLR